MHFSCEKDKGLESCIGDGKIQSDRPKRTNRAEKNYAEKNLNYNTFHTVEYRRIRQ